MSILKISEGVSLAIHAISIIALKKNTRISVIDIAKELNVSKAHLAKVMQKLNKAGFVSSNTGPKGGFILEKTPDLITIMDLYNAIEVSFPSESCLFGEPVCKKHNCLLNNLAESINNQVKDNFMTTTISDLVKHQRTLA